MDRKHGYRHAARYFNPIRSTSELLSGMYVRASVSNGVKANTILAPQQGITRDAKGNATVLVVGQDHKVESRQVTVDRVIVCR